MYASTCQAPMRREALRNTPHPHGLPTRGGPLVKFSPAAAHPMHPGGGKIYTPTGQVTNRQDLPRIPPNLHNFPPNGKLMAKFGKQTTHTSPIWGYPWKYGTWGGHPNPISSGMHPGGVWVSKPPVQGGGLGELPWVHTPLPPPPPPQYPPSPLAPAPPPPRGWTNQEDRGYPTPAPPAPELAALGLLDAAVHAFASALQGLVASGVGCAHREGSSALATPPLLCMRYGERY